MLNTGEVRFNYYAVRAVRVFVIVLLIILVSNLISNPEAIGEFFGKIVKSFKAAK